MGVIDQFSEIMDLAVEHAWFAFLCILVLWSIHLINWLMKYRLNYLGIYPRHIMGLPGIIFSPFLHGDFNHLFLNSIPAFILIDLVSIYGKFVFVTATIYIILVGGFAVWLFGRRALHVGASGLMMGYWGLLLANSYRQGGAMTIILAAICLYYLSSMALSLLPMQREASWEGHLFGCLAGVSYVFVFPHLPLQEIAAKMPSWVMTPW